MMPMPLNPMMMPPMHPPIQGGDDTTMVFIIVIIFCCSVFCAFIYFYIQQENEDETSDTCTEHTDSVSCSADTSCSWNTESFLCNKIESISVTKCSVEEHVLSGECKSCPKFPNGSFSMKSPEEVILDGSDDTTCSVKQPCPENYHVSGGGCVVCEGSLTRPAGDDPTSSEDTVCKRALCNNNQRIDCDGSCGDETCCCVDCPSGQESTKVHDTSPDDASVSDAQCVEIGMGVSSQLQDPSSSGSSQSSNEQLCNLNQRVNSSGNCENCRLGETTSSRHDPNGGETQCDKADCSEGQYALHTIPGGGACAFCSGLNTNDGGFRPNDMTKGECLKCKAESYLSDTNTCLPCPGDKINPAGSFFKTDTSMIGESVCRSPLCSDTQKIDCYKGSSSDDWNCGCQDCGSDTGGNQQYSITPHTIHPEDYPPFISVEDTEVQYSSQCVTLCDGAGYISEVSGFEEIVLECEREGLCLGIECEEGTDCSDNGDNCNVCSERNLKGTLTRIDGLITQCSNKSNDGLNILKGRIKTLLLSSPCPVNYKYSVGVPDTLLDSPNSCVRCENEREIGSYPEGRVDNFDSNHPHSNPRANAGDQSTVCKGFPCRPDKPLECSGGLNADNLCPGGYICGSACPSGETGLPLINNGNHQISPYDAMGSDVTVCRDPNAIVATCGNINGLGGTIAEECGENYSPVTGDALETLCEGSTCDLTPGTGADYDKCCVKNETCAGRILYEGNVGNVTSGGVITINLPDETSSLSDEIIDKKIRFTVSSDQENLIGTINNYEYLNGEHKVQVTYDIDDGNVIPTDETITFIILEELSSSCPTGEISNNNPGFHCIGSSCNFTGLTDPDICCIVPATCGDADGSGNPVTNSQCGTGYTYNTSSAASNCAGSTCFNGTYDQADKATCCIGGYMLSNDPLKINVLNSSCPGINGIYTEQNDSGPSATRKKYVKDDGWKILFRAHGSQWRWKIYNPAEEVVGFDHAEVGEGWTIPDDAVGWQEKNTCSGSTFELSPLLILRGVEGQIPTNSLNYALNNLSDDEAIAATTGGWNNFLIIGSSCPGINGIYTEQNDSGPSANRKKYVKDDGWKILFRAHGSQWRWKIYNPAEEVVGFNRALPGSGWNKPDDISGWQEKNACSGSTFEPSPLRVLTGG